MVEIGPLRHRVSIERRSPGLDSFRNPVDTWTSLGTYYAEVRTLSGRELLAAQQVRAETSARVVMRAGAVAVTAEDRVVFGPRYLKILAAFDPEERGRVLWIDCAEWPGAAADG